MKEKIIKWGSHRRIQQTLFGAPDNSLKRSQFISVYRVSLVKDESISFGHPNRYLAYQPGTVACKQPHGQPVFTIVK